MSEVDSTEYQTDDDSLRLCVGCGISALEKELVTCTSCHYRLCADCCRDDECVVSPTFLHTVVGYIE